MVTFISCLYISRYISPTWISKMSSMISKSYLHSSGRLLKLRPSIFRVSKLFVNPFEWNVSSYIPRMPVVCIRMMFEEEDDEKMAEEDPEQVELVVDEVEEEEVEPMESDLDPFPQYQEFDPENEYGDSNQFNECLLRSNFLYSC